jgi:hypothetical protein
MMHESISFTVPIEFTPSVASLQGGSWTALPWSDVPVALTVTLTPEFTLSVRLRYRSANDEPEVTNVKTFVRVSVGTFSRRLLRLELNLGRLPDDTALRKAAHDLRLAVERMAKDELRPGAKLNYLAAEEGLGLSALATTPPWMVDAIKRARLEGVGVR